MSVNELEVLLSMLARIRLSLNATDGDASATAGAAAAIPLCFMLTHAKSALASCQIQSPCPCNVRSLSQHPLHRRIMHGPLVPCRLTELAELEAEGHIQRLVPLKHQQDSSVTAQYSGLTCAHSPALHLLLAHHNPRIWHCKHCIITRPLVPSSPDSSKGLAMHL